MKVVTNFDYPFVYNEKELNDCALSKLASHIVNVVDNVVAEEKVDDKFSFLTDNNDLEDDDINPCLHLFENYSKHYNKDLLEEEVSIIPATKMTTTTTKATTTAKVGNDGFLLKISKRMQNFISNVVLVYEHNNNNHKNNEHKHHHGHYHKLTLNQFSDMAHDELPLHSVSFDNDDNPWKFFDNDNDKEEQQKEEKAKTIEELLFDATTTYDNRQQQPQNNIRRKLKHDDDEKTEDLKRHDQQQRHRREQEKEENSNNNNNNIPNYIENNFDTINLLQNRKYYGKQVLLMSSSGSTDINNDDNEDPYATYIDWSSPSKNPDGVSIVHPPINQGSCGSCWSIVTTGTLEASISRTYAYKSYHKYYESDSDTFDSDSSTMDTSTTSMDSTSSTTSSKSSSSSNIIESNNNSENDIIKSNQYFTTTAAAGDNNNNNNRRFLKKHHHHHHHKKRDDEDGVRMINPNESVINNSIINPFDGSSSSSITKQVQQIQTMILNKTRLSIQELIDCDTAYNKACIGGNPILAFWYLHKNGITNEQTYPYVGNHNHPTTHSYAHDFDNDNDNIVVDNNDEDEDENKFHNFIDTLFNKHHHQDNDNDNDEKKESIKTQIEKKCHDEYKRYYDTKTKSYEFQSNKVATTNAWGILTSNHEQNIVNVIRYIGPVGVGLNGADPTFLMYKGGIYDTDESCGQGLSTHNKPYYKNSKQQQQQQEEEEEDTNKNTGTQQQEQHYDLTPNHALLLVGYGEEQTSNPITNTTSIIKYFIARNSWGKGWGENGYVRIRRFKYNEYGKKGYPGLCGLAGNPSIAIGGTLLHDYGQYFDNIINDINIHSMNNNVNNDNNVNVDNNSTDDVTVDNDQNTNDSNISKVSSITTTTSSGQKEQQQQQQQQQVQQQQQQVQHNNGNGNGNGVISIVLPSSIDTSKYHNINDIDCELISYKKIIHDLRFDCLGIDPNIFRAVCLGMASLLLVIVFVIYPLTDECRRKLTIRRLRRREQQQQRQQQEQQGDGYDNVNGSSEGIIKTTTDNDNGLTGVTNCNESKPLIMNTAACSSSNEEEEDKKNIASYGSAL